MKLDRSPLSWLMIHVLHFCITMNICRWQLISMLSSDVVLLPLNNMDCKSISIMLFITLG